MGSHVLGPRNCRYDPVARTLAGSPAINSFYEHHKDSINWHYRCFDRILLNGLIQPFQQPERVIFQPLSPRRATPRSLVHTDACDHGSPQADRGNRYNPASASPNLRQNPHSARGSAPAYVPRFRALALFGRRPPQRVQGFLMPASKNCTMHNRRHHRCPSAISAFLWKADTRQCD
jgi:hypothetical protein